MVSSRQQEAVKKLLSEDALHDLYESGFTGKLRIEWDKGKIKKFDLSSRITLGKKDFPIDESYDE